jgi:hypothetical protein
VGPRGQQLDDARLRVVESALCSAAAIDREQPRPGVERQRHLGQVNVTPDGGEVAVVRVADGEPPDRVRPVLQGRRTAGPLTPLSGVTGAVDWHHQLRYPGGLLDLVQGSEEAAHLAVVVLVLAACGAECGAERVDDHHLDLRPPQSLGQPLLPGVAEQWQAVPAEADQLHLPGVVQGDVAVPADQLRVGHIVVEDRDPPGRALHLEVTEERHPISE